MNSFSLPGMPKHRSNATLKFLFCIVSTMKENIFSTSNVFYFKMPFESGAVTFCKFIFPFRNAGNLLEVIPPGQFNGFTQFSPLKQQNTINALGEITSQ